MAITAPAHIEPALTSKRNVVAGAQKVLEELASRMDKLGSHNSEFESLVKAVDTFLKSEHKSQADIRMIAAKKGVFDQFISKQNLSDGIKDLASAYSAAILNLTNSVTDRMPRSAKSDNSGNKFRRLEDIGLATQQDQTGLIAQYISNECQEFKLLANHR